MDKNPIIVLASGNGSTFQAIVENCKDAQVTMLISDQPDCYALERAKKLGIPTYSVHKELTSEQIHENFISFIPAIRPQPVLIVLAGYMRILPPEFVQTFPRTLNIHPSLLPKYKGLNTYRRVLGDGGQVHGTTVHQVDETLDGGPILAQQTVSIKPGDTVDDLQRRTQAVERVLYPKIIDLVVTRQMGLQAPI